MRNEHNPNAIFQIMRNLECNPLFSTASAGINDGKSCGRESLIGGETRGGWRARVHRQINQYPLESNRAVNTSAEEDKNAILKQTGSPDYGITCGL